MPKLNVQQNNQNVIQAFKNALAIGNLKGIIASDGNHNFSTAGSNRNLLDNPFFTVNQRSATTVTLNATEAYIADRWIVGAFGTYTHNSDNTITITCPNSTAFAGLTQRIDPIYKGGTYTFSIRLNDDTVISLQGTMPSGSGLNVYNITINGTAWQVLFRSDGSAYWITLRCNVANATLTVKAVKLELGSISTISNDAPPNFAEELAKCQRYFWRLNGAANYSAYGLAVAHTTTSANLFVTTPVQMRATPTVTFSGTFQLRVYNSAGDTRGITAISVDTIASNVIKLNITAASLTAGWIMQLRNAGATGYIDFSADL